MFLYSFSFAGKVFSSNYLIPHEKGGISCISKSNCLSCTSDAKCAWCSDSQNCVDKSKNSSLCQYSNPKLRPSQCSSCAKFIHCSDCVTAKSDGSCEWLANDARVSTVLLDWESLKPHLCSKFPLFKTSWWMLRALSQLSPLYSSLPYLRAFQWGTVWPCT